MNSNEYKYDVAFSFLAEDEQLALDLSDRISRQLRTFVYSERQKEIAGTDGEKVFNAVFQEEARLVVVLYRREWGQTPWTRIEETAIRNRGHDFGYDFVMFIPLDEPPTAPQWLPKAKIWIGLARWGLDGAASVIDARAQELGSEPHEETVEGRAVRLARSQDFAKKRVQFLASREGSETARQDFDLLRTEVERLVVAIKSKSGISFEVKTGPLAVVLVGRVGVSVVLNYPYPDSAKEAYLEVTTWHGHPPLAGVTLSAQPKQLAKRKLLFDRTLEGVCWVGKLDKESRQYSAKALAEALLKWVLDRVDSEDSKADPGPVQKIR